MTTRTKLVVIGNGMVGHRFVERFLDTPGSAAFSLTVFCEEPRLAYDRVNLSKLFEGYSPEDLALADPAVYAERGVDVLLGDRAVSVDRARKVVQSASGREIPYDKLVLATGAAPFVPPIPGRDARGCFVYRTVDDLAAIEAYAEEVHAGVVIGGGLLGLEAANALRNLSLETHVVEVAPRLMALQVDEAGGAILRGRLEALGLMIHTGVVTAEIVASEGRVSGLRFADGGALPAELVVFSAGIRPRDELARACGLALGERGGIAIDERCCTSDPDVYAIGECAVFEGKVFGLVAPGYKMAEVAAQDILSSGTDLFSGFDMSTKLKLMGVDVASFGDAFARTPGARVMSFVDTTTEIYKKLVVSADKRLLLGGMLVGDASSYGQLQQICSNRVELPPQAEELILPSARGTGSGAGFGIGSLPPSATICSCHNVTKGAICDAIVDERLTEVGAVKACTKAGTGCGSCVTLVGDLLKIELKRAGLAVSNHLCEHFPHSRQELLHLVRVHAIDAFDDLLARHGRGAGCEICKPAVASILASTYNQHVLDERHVALQDTNDRFLANLQRDGTYSVVPRVAGGEITPEHLIILGQVARRYRLYTKITGGQRVDLFGARLEQLPQIWQELVDAGFESGHAYGKALRTVKSCVGSTWCRYGVQDAVGLAVRLENRYKGLRAPHKIKSAVSGCARECAEAQSKDFGVIATEKGYNLYVGGNGGMKPQHAQLLAIDLDEETLVRYVDRFLMFYIRTAERLQRTASWLSALEGGLEYLRSVVVDDRLGIAAELEAEMQRVVDTYECEWKATLADPRKLARFRTFVNSDAPDPSIVFVPERAQHRPASWGEKSGKLEEVMR